LDSRLPDPFDGRDPMNSKKAKYHPERWKELDSKVRSVFAVHLHNQWNKNFPAGGWIKRLVIDYLGLEGTEWT